MSNAPPPDETVNVIDHEPREFVRIEEGHYILAVPSLAIEMDVERLRLERHQWHAALTILCRLPGARTFDGVLTSGDFNLSSINARQSLARSLRPISKAADRGVSDIDWLALLEELSCRVTEAERIGNPAVRLSTVPPRGPERWYQAFGFCLPQHHPAMIFGDGDVLKTYTSDAIAVELARQGLYVGLVDWEMSEDEHHERVARLDAAQLDRIAYLSCARPLTQERDRVSRMCRDHQLDYLVFDSVGFGAHEKLEAAESPMLYFREVRSVPVRASLHIAHVAKADDGEHRQKPFGSAYWFNSVRALWLAKRAENGPDPHVIDVGFYPRKFNLGSPPRAFALRFAFDEGATTVRSVQIAEIESLAKGMGVRERMAHLLRRGPMTVATIAEELEKDENTIRQTANREIKQGRWFTRVPDPDGVYRIGLLDRASST